MAPMIRSKLPLNALANLLNQHTAPTFVLGEDGRVLMWNRACAALTGVDSASVVGTREHWRGFYAAERPCLADLVLNDTIETAPDLYAAFSDSRIAPGAISVEGWCDMPGAGRRAYLALEAVTVFDDAGAKIGVIETIRDLTSAKDAESSLRALAGLDGLTGLPNRRTFDSVLAKEWRRSRRSGDPISLLMIDLDNFKQYNDSLGHACGDQCLTAIGRVITENIQRVGDFSARFGGEEFVVVLPSTDASGATTVAENLRSSVERRAIRHPRNSVSPYVTTSIGAATMVPVPNKSAEEVLRLADMALYQAKDLGRNRVCAIDNWAI